MTQKEYDLLEKIFAREIEGMVYQGHSKLLHNLEREGLITKVTRIVDENHRFPVRVSGYVLTYEGNFAYCQSPKALAYRNMVEEEMKKERKNES